MNIGRAQVSTGEQTLDLQLGALAKDGCERIFTETASGAKSQRPILLAALAYARQSGQAHRLATLIPGARSRT